MNRISRQSMQLQQLQHPTQRQLLSSPYTRHHPLKRTQPPTLSRATEVSSEPRTREFEGMATQLIASKPGFVELRGLVEGKAQLKELVDYALDKPNISKLLSTIFKLPAVEGLLGDAEFRGKVDGIMDPLDGTVTSGSNAERLASLMQKIVEAMGPNATTFIDTIDDIFNTRRIAKLDYVLQAALPEPGLAKAVDILSKTVTPSRVSLINQIIDKALSGGIPDKVVQIASQLITPERLQGLKKNVDTLEPYLPTKRILNLLAAAEGLATEQRVLRVLNLVDSVATPERLLVALDIFDAYLTQDRLTYYIYILDLAVTQQRVRTLASALGFIDEKREAQIVADAAKRVALLVDLGYTQERVSLFGRLYDQVVTMEKVKGYLAASDIVLTPYRLQKFFSIIDGASLPGRQKTYVDRFMSLRMSQSDSLLPKAAALADRFLNAERIDKLGDAVALLLSGKYVRKYMLVFDRIFTDERVKKLNEAADRVLEVDAGFKAKVPAMETEADLSMPPTPVVPNTKVEKELEEIVASSPLLSRNSDGGLDYKVDLTSAENQNDQILRTFAWSMRGADTALTPSIVTQVLDGFAKTASGPDLDAFINTLDLVTEQSTSMESFRTNFQVLYTFTMNLMQTTLEGVAAVEDLNSISGQDVLSDKLGK